MNTRRCCILLLVLALCNAEDYPTCIVPDTTIINQLRERLSSLEEQLVGNFSDRVTSLEKDLRNKSEELRILKEESRMLNVNVQSIKNHLRNVIQNLTAVQERELALHDPNWFTPFNGFQYHVTKTEQSWEAGRRLCRSMGGDLAALGIRDSNVRRRISVNLGLENTWIGLTDRATEGAWLWIDGEEATNQNADWFPGEPSNSGGNQHCGEIWGENFNYRTNDDQCHKTQAALCERNLFP